MPLLENPLGELRMEKSIMIDARTAKDLEARGVTLPSDAFVERDRGENMAPSQFMQDVVDANTAARLAYSRGVQLAPSVDAAAGVSFGGTPEVVGVGGRKSKLPSAILESFQKQPPIIPQMQSQAAEFDPAFVQKMQEANRRLNKVGGEIVQSSITQPVVQQPVVSKIPQSAHKPLMTEQRTIPATNMYATVQPYVPAPAAPMPQYGMPAPASVDYSLISAIVKEAVREVVREQLTEVVKNVLKEEREGVTKQNINENLQIKIGNSLFSGTITGIQAPKKK